MSPAVGLPSAAGPAPQSDPVVTTVLASVIGSTGLAAGGTAGALLVVDLTGSPALAGLPVAVHLAGSAAGAALVSAFAARGRRGLGLALGYVVGAVGAVLVVVAAASANIWLVLAGSFPLGTANSSLFLSRYAAAAAVRKRRRGRVLGWVFLGTAVGAVLSPLLLGPAGRLAGAAGLPSSVGAYLVAALTFGGAGVFIAVRTKPGVAPLAGDVPPRLPRRAAVRRATRGPIRTALLVLAGTNFLMVGVMTVAAVHLRESGQSLVLVGVLVGVHVLAMFAPAPITGRLADRFGGWHVALGGAVLLVLAGAVGLVVDPAMAMATTGTGPTVAMAAHLVLTGLGWNCGVVGGSTLLVAAVPDEVRPALEGIGEATMGIAAAAGAPAAGLLAVPGSYTLPSIVLAALSLAAAVALGRLTMRRQVRQGGVSTS